MFITYDKVLCTNILIYKTKKNKKEPLIKTNAHSVIIGEWSRSGQFRTGGLIVSRRSEARVNVKINEPAADRILPKTGGGYPTSPSSCCLNCCAVCFKALQRRVRDCCTERPQRGSTAQVCWCLTKYNTERPRRENPSAKLRRTKDSALLFLVVTWAVGLIMSVHLSLQNFHASSPHQLLSSFFSSSFLSLALSLILFWTPAFAFCDCESVFPFLLHH